MAGLASGLLAAPSVDILPPRPADPSLSLNGEWNFKYLPSENLGADARFFAAERAPQGWGRIRVPGHWELQGFAEPTYKRTAEGTGLYHRNFDVPADWRDRRVLLRFEGVLYGYTVWVNGKEVGEWDSGYNPATFDVTDAVRFGGENTLAVKVLTQSRQSDFDRNDCWGISGVYREVTLIALPRLHLTDYEARTTLKPDGSAEVAFSVSATGGDRVRGVLKGPDGATKAGLDTALDAQGRGAAKLVVARPELWTAETPSLYTLSLELLKDGAVTHRYEDRVGLREISFQDGVMKLNGRPIKLRGINHHDIWPEEGRVATEARLRQDLELIRDANINFVRTAHYPPHPRLVELCDEMGLYVMCEVPFGHGDKNLTDPTFTEPLRTRARATVNRDKNRPSVIVWSIGNENPLTDITIEIARWVKETDPTRPVCFPTVGSYFRNNEDRYEALPPFVEIMSPHYASSTRIRELAARHKRTILITEYAHALGLATDKIEGIWETMQEIPGVAGGAIWMFQDQGILRRSATPGNPHETTPYVWKDAATYYDTALTDGADGIVYSDRTPQADYWQVQKVYSPVVLELAKASAPPDLKVTNRHDFRSLEGMRLSWKLQDAGRVIQSGELRPSAAPGEAETLSLPLTVPGDQNGVYSVLVECRNESGRLVVSQTFPLRGEQAPSLADTFLASLPGDKKISLERGDHRLEVRAPDYSVRLDTRTGRLSVLDASGSVLIEDMRPHFGRRTTMAEVLRASRRTSRAQMDHDLRDDSVIVWGEESAALAPLTVIKTDAVQAEGGVKLTLVAAYERVAGEARSAIDGDIGVLVRADGSLDIGYEFRPRGAVGTLVEAGLALVSPVSASELRWLGDGPWPGYPGKEKLNEFGRHHLNREDLAFNGNRRRVDLAALTDPKGAGFVVLGAGMDVGVENDEKEIRLSHNVLVSARGNKGSAPDRRIDVSKLDRVAGSVRVLPLAGSAAWPALLTRWLGSPASSAAPFKPFFHSYDQ